jgi:hypothetical protein
VGSGSTVTSAVVGAGAAVLSATAISGFARLSAGVASWAFAAVVAGGSGAKQSEANIAAN